MTPFAMFVLLSATAMVLIGSDRRRPTGFKAAAIVEAMSTIQSQSTSNPSSIAQKAATIALIKDALGERVRRVEL